MHEVGQGSIFMDLGSMYNVPGVGERRIKLA